MNKYFHLKNLSYWRIIIYFTFFTLLVGIIRTTPAANLRIEPSAPIIAVGESIPLTVFGNTENLIWERPEKGRIQVQSDNAHAIYTAPDEVGQYYVAVDSMEGEDAAIQITVLPTEAATRTFSREKSVWDVFMNRNNISALALSPDGKTLWVGTHGGLEERDAKTGELINVFTNLDGLPDNIISTIVDEGHGQLWIGTALYGIAHRNENQEWEVFNIDNSDLPDNLINALVSDENGGVWIATGIPFDEEKFNDWFDKMTFSNSLLDGLLGGSFDDPLGGFFGESSNYDLFNGLFGINRNSYEEELFDSPYVGTSMKEMLFGEGLLSLLDCTENDPFLEFIFGNSFTGSEGGLVHLSKEGQWTIFNTENTHLPSDIISDIVSDGQGGLWVGTHCGGLAHLSQDHQWTFYNTKNSGLPSNFINTLYRDDKTGLWVTTAFHGVAHRNLLGKWRVYDTSDGLPSNTVTHPISDGDGGVWMGTGNVLEETGGLVHLNSQGKITVFDTANSPLPENSVIQLLNDGHNGIWIGTYGKGLVHRSDAGHWTQFNNEGLGQPNTTNSGNLPDNFTHVTVDDGAGGVWVGTSSFSLYDGGLAHFNSHEWTIYNVDNSALPNNDIWSLAKDDHRGLWIGTLGGGLAYRDHDNNWTIYNSTNSPLPDNEVIALLNDNYDGLWIGTANNGLVHLSNEGEWLIFDTSNSDLPDNMIGVLSYDDNGELWIGTAVGLVHLSKENQWTVYNTDNSPLPHNLVTNILKDGNNGLWLATGTKTQGGLVYLQGDQWTVYNETNSVLPSNGIRSLTSDGSGGVWVGTLKGLVHRSIRGDWTLFNPLNSGLPSDMAMGLANDGSNGLWIIGWGLAHLTFSYKPFICETVPNITDEQCDTLLQSHRSAIVIHPNGSGDNSGVDNMATHAYQTLFLRGYDHDEIYYIAYKPNLDFNRDGRADYEIVDAPITLTTFIKDQKLGEPISLTHIENAFNWAKERHHNKAEGVPEEPLVIIFVGHGQVDQLSLGFFNNLDKWQLRALLDDYQAETGNKVIVILEACHTGSLIDALQAPNRLIVTSTDKNLAYYKDAGRTSFSAFYFDDLYRGSDYKNSWSFVKDQIFPQIGVPFNQQVPQFVSQIAPIPCLNDCYGQLPQPELQPSQLSHFASVGESIELVVNIQDNGNQISGASVSIMTPQTQYDEDSGIELTEPWSISLTVDENQERWATWFNDFTQPGEYNFIFKADYAIRSGSRMVSALEPVTIHVQQCQTHAYYNVDTQTLHLPAVKILKNGEEMLYQVECLLINTAPITLELNMDFIVPIAHDPSICIAHFDVKTEKLYVPAMNISNGIGGTDTYNVVVQRVPDTSPWQFTLDSLILQ